MSINFSAYSLSLVVLFLSLMNAHADIVYVWSGVFFGNGGAITKLDTNGVAFLFPTNDVAAWNGPVGLALDNLGNLYAGVPSNSFIWRFSPNGTYSRVGGGDSMSGLGFDDIGELYATAPNFTVVFKLNGYGGSQLTASNSTYNSCSPPMSYPLNLCIGPKGSENPGLAFTVLATTNASLALTNWMAVGGVTEISNGFYQFADPRATNGIQTFYRVLAQ
jgi:hypothetical protein